LALALGGGLCESGLEDGICCIEETNG